VLEFPYNIAKARRTTSVLALRRYTELKDSVNRGIEINVARIWK
jgi:hypothetical protein